MERNRLQWLDIAKGITILLMILGHTSIPRIPSNFIFSFHMPLFFLASGWCTNWGKDSLIRFINKKIKNLIIPFVVYSIIVILLYKLVGNDDFSFYRVLSEGWRMYALWFVPVLFVSLIIAKIIMSHIHLSWLRYFICGFLIIIGVLFSYFHISLPWTLSTVPYATCLVLMGSSLKRYQEYINEPKWWILVLGFVLALMISYKWRLDMASNQIIPVIILTIGAISGTAMVFTVSSFLTKIPLIASVFTAIGKETFVVLAFSQILCLTISHFYPCNKIIEYGLMFCLLLFIVLIKNGINKLIGRKVL